MTDNVLAWVKAQVERLQPKAPVLEVGSRDINGSVRSLFPEPYTGMDMGGGKGVDLIRDATQPIPGTYNTVVCCETLEHIDDMPRAVKNIGAVLEPGGVFIGTIPFIFGEHNYPSDYWRVTRSGFEYLLKEAGLVDIETEYAAGCTHVYATARKP